ncbi:MAG TPA: hypothetical protein DCO86_04525 [Spirochaetaceae bacterium]|nr:hypothetical protein [Spirochaetaceae bacterium]
MLKSVPDSCSACLSFGSSDDSSCDRAPKQRFGSGKASDAVKRLHMKLHMTLCFPFPQGKTLHVFKKNPQGSLRHGSKEQAARRKEF